MGCCIGYTQRNNFLNLGELCLVPQQINEKKILFYVLLFNIMNLFEPEILIIFN